MNVYMIHHEEEDFLVVEQDYASAIRLWESSLDADPGIRGEEPDSIACLGEAILPKQAKIPTLDPISGLSRPVPSVAIQCGYCGAMNADAYKGPCPQCPPQGRR